MTNLAICGKIYKQEGDNMRTYSEEEVIEMIRLRAEKAGSQKELARIWGVDPSYISYLLSGGRGITDKVLTRLGLGRAIVDSGWIPTYKLNY
jgi:transcriptional regulator with XRE-family HTH domain